MCGHYYSTVNRPRNTEQLQRRGPDAWQEAVIPDLGYFGSARLTTRGAVVDQPVIRPEGVLQYNGATYNSLHMSDTEWIANHIADTVDTIRSMDGEYALIWCTEQSVTFCTDVFGMRPLYYYSTGKDLTVSSLPGPVQELHSRYYRCQANSIYTWDRTSGTVTRQVNRQWDLSQTNRSYDTVWQMWEKSIIDRYTPNTSIAISSGYDSGMVACTANKFYSDIDCYTIHNEHEQNDVLRLRGDIHSITTIDLKGQHGTPEMQNQLAEVFPDNEHIEYNWFMNAGDTAIYRDHMLPKKKRIMLTGDGGDDIYSDYGFHGHRMRKHSRFGGHFPDVLANVWPWHENNVFQDFHNRTEAVGGHWGIEMRCPMMSVALVQAWLNTTAQLKNRKHKGWMAQYMLDHKYPFADIEKLGPSIKMGSYHPADRYKNITTNK